MAPGRVARVPGVHHCGNDVLLLCVCVCWLLVHLAVPTSTLVCCAYASIKSQVAGFITLMACTQLECHHHHPSAVYLFFSDKAG